MNKKFIGIRIEPELDKKVQELADSHSISKSSQYRNIVKYYFSDWMRKIFR